MANVDIKYALNKGTQLRSTSKNILGFPSGERLTYTIEKPLGQGGFGITYLATSKIGNISQPFAIKEFFVKGQCWREPDNPRMMFPKAEEAKRDVKEWLREFEHEAELLNRICKENENIVQVNEVFRSNDTAYYVMEYLENGNLRDVVRQKGALHEEVALSYILPIAEAVYKLHTMRTPLLHCDIKHDNIMLRKHLNGKVDPVLIDFGESRHFNKNGDLTTTHTSPGGSRGFSPMEQYVGITTFAPQVDVYALAATLYYLVTGEEPPYADDVTEELIDKKLPMSLNSSFRNAILHGLQKEKEKRTKDVSDFIKEVCGQSLRERKTESIFVPELPIGYLLKNSGKLYEIISVSKRTPFFIQYNATATDERTGNSPSGMTKRPKYDIYEFFDQNNHHRQEDKSVLAKGDITMSQQQFLDLCKKKTKRVIVDEFRCGSNLRWVTFAANNTQYLVDTHYKKPFPWKKVLYLVGIGLGCLLLVFGAKKIYTIINPLPIAVDTIPDIQEDSIHLILNISNVDIRDVNGNKMFSYSGQALGGVPNGRGTATYPVDDPEEREKFEGIFINGKRTNGTLTWRNGEIYKGSFENDKLKEGKFTSKDGSYYEGLFNNNRPYIGIWYNKDGSIFKKVNENEMSILVGNYQKRILSILKLNKDEYNENNKYADYLDSILVACELNDKVKQLSSHSAFDYDSVLYGRINEEYISNLIASKNGLLPKSAQDACEKNLNIIRARAKRYIKDNSRNNKK
ncbi:MAG: protein kinase [Prevotella sp.]|nr:protein kinase [Prevotella sp.]